MRAMSTAKHSFCETSSEEPNTHLAEVQNFSVQGYLHNGECDDGGTVDIIVHLDVEQICDAADTDDNIYIPLYMTGEQAIALMADIVRIFSHDEILGYATAVSLFSTALQQRMEIINSETEPDFSA